MASWYFLQAREFHSILQGDDLLEKERRHCQSLLDTYYKMRKSTQEHLLFRQRYLEALPPSTGTCKTSEEDRPHRALGRMPPREYRNQAENNTFKTST
jgi:hypothetical protein